MALAGAANIQSVVSAASTRRPVKAGDLGVVADPPTISSVRRSLPWRVPLVPVFLLKKGLLDFIVDTEQPCFCSGGTIAEMFRFGLELVRPFFGSAQLERELVRQIHGAGAVLFRQLGGLLQQGDDGTPGVIGDNIGVPMAL
jgi:hypothetical protein